MAKASKKKDVRGQKRQRDHLDDPYIEPRVRYGQKEERAWAAVLMSLKAAKHRTAIAERM